MLFDAIRIVQDGGAPLGTGNSYYTVRAMQDLWGGLARAFVATDVSGRYPLTSGRVSV